MIGVPEKTKLRGAVEVAGVVAAPPKAVDGELEESAADDGGADEGGDDDEEVEKIGGKLGMIELDAAAEAVVESGEDGLDEDEVNEDIAIEDEVDGEMADDEDGTVEAALVVERLEEDELVEAVCPAMVGDVLAAVEDDDI